MNKPKVTIIIPVYNEEKYLAYCISSIFSQSFKDFEIIIVDDGSTDRSNQIGRNFVKKGVLFLKQKHQGPGTARNLGAKKARGDILVFVDADMMLDKYFLEYLVRPIIEKDVMGTFQEEELVANQQNIWAKCWSFNSDLPAKRRRPVNLPKEIGVFRAIQKKYFDKVGGFDPERGYMDDGSLSTKLKTKAMIAPGSICFHFNPESLNEVFYSARWIGKSGEFPKSLTNLLRYSPLNSMRIGLRNVIFRKQPIVFLFFNDTATTEIYTE